MQHWRASHQRPLQQTRQQPANSSRTARPQHSSKCCCLPSAARQDLYLVLGVPYDVDSDAIKAAFRAQAKLLHPDVNKAADAEAAFRLLKRAHEVLSDTMLRVAHDSELRESLGEASAALRARDPRFARWVGAVTEWAGEQLACMWQLTTPLSLRCGVPPVCALSLLHRCVCLSVTHAGLSAGGVRSGVTSRCCWRRGQLRSWDCWTMQRQHSADRCGGHSSMLSSRPPAPS